MSEEKVAVGDAVWESTSDLQRSFVGTIDALYLRHWGKHRGKVHSVRTTHRIELCERNVRLVLFWNRGKGRWCNVFHKAAQYHIVREW
jgi:hypothetical protein